MYNSLDKVLVVPTCSLFKEEFFWSAHKLHPNLFIECTTVLGNLLIF